MFSLILISMANPTSIFQYIIIGVSCVHDCKIYKPSEQVCSNTAHIHHLYIPSCLPLGCHKSATNFIFGGLCGYSLGNDRHALKYPPSLKGRVKDLRTFIIQTFGINCINNINYRAPFSISDRLHEKRILIFTKYSHIE